MRINYQLLPKAQRGGLTIAAQGKRRWPVRPDRAPSLGSRSSLLHLPPLGLLRLRRGGSERGRVPAVRRSIEIRNSGIRNSHCHGRVENIPPLWCFKCNHVVFDALKANVLEGCNTIRMNDLASQCSSNATMTSFLKWLHLVAFDTTRRATPDWL